MFAFWPFDDSVGGYLAIVACLTALAMMGGIYVAGRLSGNGSKPSILASWLRSKFWKAN